MIDLKLEFDYPEMPMFFDLQVKQGERIGVIGESGAGKSTLLNLIAGFEEANRGSLLLNGQDHFRTQPHERPVAMLFQDNNLFPHLTVEQNIGLALASSLRLNTAQKAQVAQIAQQMGIADLLKRPAHQLSGGQKQRAALARTLLQDKPILLLDEPFSALDPDRRAELLDLVEQICQARNLTLLMVTHQIEETKGLFNRILTVTSGRISA
ncbi:thiamine ABC transporter, ATP-binding protein [Pasteurellaceae bacterium RH1A]|nr:thiamine ABC transporter, ATP-binding protein [Pasteurellaceae bacterium RH1A]